VPVDQVELLLEMEHPFLIPPAVEAAPVALVITAFLVLLHLRIA
jgi:hypothetical protein